jgi:PTH1 family peptidyl-tRNA hydrolase
MRSIIAAVGSREFPRLRIGIGRPEAAGRTAVHHVLSTFSPEEREALNAVLDRAVEAAECVIREGIQQAMNRYNA